MKVKKANPANKHAVKKNKSKLAAIKAACRLLEKHGDFVVGRLEWSGKRIIFNTMNGFCAFFPDGITALVAERFTVHEEAN